MLKLLGALVLAQASLEGPIFTNPALFGSPVFEFAPTSGAGMSAACAGVTPTGSKGEALTWGGRTGSATCLKTAGSSPQLIANGDLVTLSTNQLRVMPGADGTTVLGILVEPAATNVAIRSQQIDNAAWSPANSGVAAPTVTADQAVAPDGTTTAERVQVPATTVAGGQYSFVYNSTSSVNPGSGQIFLRGNGTSGTVDLAQYGNGGWHAVACSYVSTGWTLCLNENQGAFGAPMGAIGIGNFSGLAIVGGVNRGAQDVFVWGAQLEQGARASSYIATTSAAVTRNAEPPPYATTKVAISGRATIAASFIAPNAGHAANDGVVGLSPTSSPSDAASIGIEYDATGSVGCFRQASDIPTYTFDALGLGGVQSTVDRVWCATSGASGNFYGKLTAFYTTAVKGFDLASSSVVVLGSWSTAAPPLGGVLKMVCADPTLCAGGALPGTRVAWDGDSIVYGYPQVTTSPAVELSQLIGSQGKIVSDTGENGDRALDCYNHWTARIQGRGFSTLIWSCAVNDMVADATGAATAAQVETALTAALADGEQVIVTGISPWKNSPNWTSGRQTQTDSYNSLISAWAGTHGVAYVDPSPMGGQGGDPAVLLSAYSYDLVHYSPAGQLEFAQLVQAKNP